MNPPLTAQALARSRERLLPFSTPASHGLTSVLLSQKRSIWVFLDFMVCLVGFLGCAWASPHIWFSTWTEIQVCAIVFSVCFCLTSLGVGAYEREHRFVLRSCLQLGFFAWFIALTATLAIIFFALYWKVGRYLVAFGSVGGYAGVVVYRWALSFVLNKYPYRFAVLGEPSPITEEIKKFSSQTRSGVHYFHVSEVNTLLAQYETLSQEELLRSLQNLKILDIVLTDQARKDPRIIGLCIRAMQAGCRITDEIHFYGEVFQCFPSKIISENWLVLSGIDNHRPLSSFAKRVFDFSLCLAASILLLPLLLLIAAIIKISSEGPVLFIQERQGYYGRPFNILKFRTMRDKIDVDHPPSTRKGDPRVTGIGRILRPLHFDELPQLWNILKGDMSLVGPRPEVYSFTQEITKQVPIYAFRCLVRPGLSGLSQISVGYTLDNAEATLVKLAYDLYYIKNQSFFLDLLILLRTAFTLTKRAW